MIEVMDSYEDCGLTLHLSRVVVLCCKYRLSTILDNCLVKFGPNMINFKTVDIEQSGLRPVLIRQK